MNKTRSRHSSGSSLDLSGTSGQNSDEIARAVAKLVSLAMAHGAPIAPEESDFARK
ncbi:MAG: hypothetical protein ACYDEY_07160 [Acidimicrobiales bacterium]